MIVIVGNPAWRAAAPAGPGGRACEIAIAAASRGRRVELIGRAGDDAAGDALLLALARAGVGHVALLRDPARPTPVLEPAPEPVNADAATEALTAGDADPDDDAAPPAAPPSSAADRRPALDPADVDLGLQYLTAFDVLVVTDDVPSAAWRVAIDAATFAGAHLVLLVAADPPGAADLPTDATVLATPAGPDDGAFAGIVGAYAAGLDEGVPAADAFRSAIGSAGWEALEPSA